jgi:hypothetical protein
LKLPQFETTGLQLTPGERRQAWKSHSDSHNHRPAAAEKKCLIFLPGLLANHDDGTTVEPGTLETCNPE